MKKVLSLFLSILMLCSIAAGIDFSAQAASSNGFEYSVSDGYAVIKGYTGTAADITIPNKIGGYAVREIGYDAFKYNTYLTNVRIPNSVTYINSYAFYQCTNLKSITIPKSVTAISTNNSRVFYNCISLTDIYYTGSSANWYNISGITFQSTYFDNATVHYNYTCSSHTWGSAAYTTKATTKKNGVKTYTCTVCTKTKNVSYAKIQSVKLSKSKYTYSGKAKVPTVTVYNSNGSTISSKYYTVTYVNQSTGETVSSMKSVGKYYVKVKFKKKYSGTVKKTVTIKPKSTSISSLSASSKGFTVKWGKVTTGTTGYQVRYSTSSDFSSKTTKTISGNSTTSKKITGLKAKKKYYVRVRTYKTVKIDGKSTKIYSSWSQAKSVTTKK